MPSYCNERGYLVLRERIELSTSPLPMEFRYIRTRSHKGSRTRTRQKHAVRFFHICQVSVRSSAGSRPLLGGRAA